MPVWIRRKIFIFTTIPRKGNIFILGSESSMCREEICSFRVVEYNGN